MPRNTINSSERNKKQEEKIKETGTKKATVSKKDSCVIDVLDTKGNVVETVSLPKDIFGAKINKTLMAQAVRVHLANRRRGTLSTKTRGEVEGSTRKIYKQKGTGRARHGAIRAPIFVGGGITFGPKPRDFSLQLPQKMKRAALFSALSSKLKDNQIRVVDGLLSIQPKTKHMVEVLTHIALHDKKRNILIVLPTQKDKVKTIVRAARNIEGVTLLPANLINTYDILNTKVLFFLKEALPGVTETFLYKKG